MMVGNVVSPHTPLPHVCPTASGWGKKNHNIWWSPRIRSSNPSAFSKMLNLENGMLASDVLRRIFIKSLSYVPILYPDLKDFYLYEFLTNSVLIIVPMRIKAFKLAYQKLIKNQVFKQ
jgi:hypothetical protein